MLALPRGYNWDDDGSFQCIVLIYAECVHRPMSWVVEESGLGDGADIDTILNNERIGDKMISMTWVRIIG